MSELYEIRGIGLRSVITDHLFRVGPQTIPDLLDALEHQGFTVAGRPAKTVSDALRWERERGRVRLIRRGKYGPAEMPRTTEQRIRRRAMELRARAGIAAGRDDEHFWDRVALYLD
ncbi:hypothetical protein FK535_04880 [Mycolicibacterium sp. 018/SC-01/001]|uniref:hypothetical protein n=1 Tax=Mycolicibacterium sp. 018/SC-01/001 TaxID=2592069 RepID=UPI0011808D26|nr:hypothetical protein [Mycolicibacterium sp. 018/SC-01/001]TRW87780.1 hypothetical protein FK535_04880 [Mycolicibacterium sp. 018/SC-01/001]